MSSHVAAASPEMPSPVRDQELFTFVGETPLAQGAHQALGQRPPLSWRILVVDDDPDVHQATRYALDAVEVVGRRLQLLFASSAAEARALLRVERDVALVLLDVVMETESAGLELVDFIRQMNVHRATRIVLRTGQPGYAPEFDTIVKYDINDYKSKAELSHLRLLTTVTTAVRAYQQLRALAAAQDGLELIVQASSAFHAAQGVSRFADSVLTQLAAVLSIAPEGLVCVVPGGAAGLPTVQAATGRFLACLRQPLSVLEEGPERQLLEDCLRQRSCQSSDDGVALYLGGLPGTVMAVYLDKAQALSGVDRHLLDVFCANATACLRNLSLVEQLQSQAYSDDLTGLPNRTRFIQDIDQMLGVPGQQVTLALVDIDDFGSVNDLMGHAYADQLLRAYAARLLGLLGQDEADRIVVARLGSNTFGLVGPSERLLPEVVQETVREPLVVQGAPHKLSVTSGFAALEVDLQGGDDWIKDVYLALKNAKRHSRGSHELFTPNMGQQSRARAKLLANLHAAFSQTQLFVMYQPQIDLATRRVIGLEALVRWRTEDGRMVPPDQFIPVAEQSGLILPLGQWVLQTACETMKQLLDLGLAPDRMAVNVSVVQFQRPDFVANVEQALLATGLPGHCLELEITESVAMLSAAAVEVTLTDLRAKHITVAVDDFGTGYSSLSYLDRLPIDRLKIDRAFVRQISDVQGPRIAEMITQLGLKLGVKVVAEGIENEEVLLVLRSMGCHEGQGFHIAKPMAWDVLLPWLAQQRSPAP